MKGSLPVREPSVTILHAFSFSGFCVCPPVGFMMIRVWVVLYMGFVSESFFLGFSLVSFNPGGRPRSGSRSTFVNENAFIHSFISDAHCVDLTPSDHGGFGFRIGSRRRHVRVTRTLFRRRVRPSHTKHSLLWCVGTERQSVNLNRTSQHVG